MKCSYCAIVLRIYNSYSALKNINKIFGGIMKGNKNIELANFNCTFSDQYEPMLQYFEKVVYPAFLDNQIVREYKINEKSSNKYYFTEVEIVFTEKLGYVLKGCIVKETSYRGKSIVDKNKKIVELPEDTEHKLEHAPYSIFGIILKNHRLFFIKNEGGSPSLTTFKATTQYVFEKYIEKINEMINRNLQLSLFNKEEVNPLYADLQFLPGFKLKIMPFIEDEAIEKTFDSIVDIDEVSIKFVRQNGEPDFDPIIELFDKGSELTDSEEVGTVYKKPKNKERIRSIFKIGNGIIDYFIKGKNSDKKEISLTNKLGEETSKEVVITSSEKIPVSFEENLNRNEVTEEILKAVDDSKIALTSREEVLYSEKIKILKSLIEEKIDEKDKQNKIF